MSFYTPRPSYESTMTETFSAGTTSFGVDSTSDSYGNDLDTLTLYFTLDKGQSTEEGIIATVDTATSKVTSVSYLNVATGEILGAGTQYAHRKGSGTIEITSFPYLTHAIRALKGDKQLDSTSPMEYDGVPAFTPGSNEVATVEYVDNIAISGSPDATDTTKGISEEATSGEIDAGTAAGGTGAELFVNPSALAASIYNSQLPSAGQKALLDGITSDAAEINTLDGYTGDVNDLNEMSTFFQATDISGAEAETLTDGSDAAGLHGHNKLNGVGEATDTKDYWNFQLPIGLDSIGTAGWVNYGAGATSQSYGIGYTRGNSGACGLITNGGFFTSGSNARLSFDTSKEVIVEFGLGSSRNTTSEGGFGLMEDTAPLSDYDDQTDDAVCFTVDGSGNLYAHTADRGTGHTETAITGVTLDSLNTYRIEFNPGVDAKFYVNGTLKATIATNLPSSAQVMDFGYGVGTGDSGAQYLSCTCLNFAIEK